LLAHFYGLNVFSINLTFLVVFYWVGRGGEGCGGEEQGRGRSGVEEDRGGGGSGEEGDWKGKDGMGEGRRGEGSRKG
jgi:hypothetical protein